MAFVVNKIDYTQARDNLKQVKLFGNPIDIGPGNQKWLDEAAKKNSKVNQLSSILLGKEKDAVVLEEYTGNKDNGRYFVFVEYKDWQNQQRRGITGDGNMILSTMSEIEFTDSQVLPDVNVPGMGAITMNMGPNAKYINFKGMFMFDRPEESVAWLEERKDSGAVFKFHYKNWHRYAMIARLNFKAGKNHEHISYEIGLKFLSFDQEDVVNIVKDSSKRTRLSEFAMSEVSGRLLLAYADAAASVTGLNDKVDEFSAFLENAEKNFGFISSVISGASNSMNVLLQNNVLTKAAKETKRVLGNATADLTKSLNAAGNFNKTIDNAVSDIKSKLGF